MNAKVRHPGKAQRMARDTAISIRARRHLDAAMAAVGLSVEGVMAQQRRDATLGTAVKLLRATLDQPGPELHPDRVKQARHALAEADREWWALALAYQGVIPKTVREYSHGHLPADELASLAMEGLHAAAIRWEPSRNLQFTTYSKSWMRARISRAEDRHAGLGLDGMKIARGKKVRTLLQQGLSLEGACAEVGVRVDVGLSSAFCTKVSMETPVGFSRDGGRITTLGETLEAEPQDVDGDLDTDSVSRSLDIALSHMKPLSAAIVRCRAGLGCEPMTLAQIGDVLRLSRERVRQLQVRGLRQLQREPALQRMAHQLGLATDEVPERVGLGHNTGEKHPDNNPEGRRILRAAMARTVTTKDAKMWTIDLNKWDATIRAIGEGLGTDGPVRKLGEILGVPTGTAGWRVSKLRKAGIVEPVERGATDSGVVLTDKGRDLYKSITGKEPILTHEAEEPVQDPSPESCNGGLHPKLTPTLQQTLLVAASLHPDGEVRHFDDSSLITEMATRLGCSKSAAALRLNRLAKLGLAVDHTIRLESKDPSWKHTSITPEGWAQVRLLREEAASTMTPAAQEEAGLEPERKRAPVSPQPEPTVLSPSEAKDLARDIVKLEAQRDKARAEVESLRAQMTKDDDEHSRLQADLERYTEIIEAERANAQSAVKERDKARAAAEKFSGLAQELQAELAEVKVTLDHINKVLAESAHHLQTERDENNKLQEDAKFWRESQAAQVQRSERLKSEMEAIQAQMEDVRDDCFAQGRASALKALLPLLEAAHTAGALEALGSVAAARAKWVRALDQHLPEPGNHSSDLITLVGGAM